MTKDCIISAHADYAASDYRFERRRQDADRIELEKSRHMESWWEIATGWLIIILCSCATLRILLFIFEALVAQGILVGAPR
jgi:hypothetical protein